MPFFNVKHIAARNAGINTSLNPAGVNVLGFYVSDLYNTVTATTVVATLYKTDGRTVTDIVTNSPVTLALDGIWYLSLDGVAIPPATEELSIRLTITDSSGGTSICVLPGYTVNK